ncbi:MAG: hypothetical protein HUU35_18120 [Armatimonadetes bacterium]|nr:hypothetical protein [Armatimonadota bacterium]
MVGKVLLDWHAMLDLLHELEESLPKEYQDAQNILRDAENHALEVRRKIEQERENTRADSNRLLEEASQRARALASEHEIARLAQERSDELIRNADDYARQVRDEAESFSAEVRRSAEEYADSTRRSADDYAMTLLSHLKAVVTRAQASVEDGLQQVKR